MKTIEHVVLSGLVKDLNFSQQVLPFIDAGYFQGTEQSVVYQIISNYIQEYKELPSSTVVTRAVDDDSSLTENQVKVIVSDILPDIFDDDSYKTAWLLDQTEKFCQERALYNAIIHSLKIAEGEDKNLTRDSIPHVIQQALSVSFNTDIGHDFTDDASKRFDQYQEKANKFPLSLQSMNDITGGGVEEGTLNVVIAGTGVGKSIFLCNIAADSVLQGKNVLYITLEMAEHKIAQRIDQNLLNITKQELEHLSKEEYLRRISRFQSERFGTLKIKQYPTASAHVGHFRALLNEYKNKQNFTPDVIIIDYINICASSRFKPSSNTNTYTIVKAISEELRGLAVEYKAALWSATQPTRDGMSSSDMELKDTSESIGLPQTADFMFAIISNEELDRMNQVMAKQLKNRYDEITAKNRRFILGLDKSKMKFFDVQPSEQTLMKEDLGEEDARPFVARNRSTSKFGR